ncbi:MAG: hypothetical protein PF961_03100 [Planctomycetota bacterium]|jgi:hypothetical protein|nr:hypothetical protein [Planctomycetota bacterium]
MRILITLTLILMAGLAAAAELKPGEFQLANHADGGWQGVDTDGNPVSYGMIMAEWVDPYPYFILDFDAPESDVVLKYKSKKQTVTISGQAVAYGSLNSNQSALVYERIGLVTVSMEYFGTREELPSDNPAGGYNDVLVVAGLGQGSGSFTLPDGRFYTMNGMANDAGLIFRVGDWGGDGHRRDGYAPEVFDHLNGTFSKPSKKGKDDDDSDGGDAEEGDGAGWLTPGDDGVPVSPMAKPRDFLFSVQGRGTASSN